ncbi:phage exclusion protein Lit family protein [Pseudomonas viridiflava]|uniref:phage exclusion protein Lit family protein n=1 Tax=Pseudomonas viridiflava TaxID=33069 RepID=UPI002ECBBF86|nr:phage exclusion protein Lit family protein [Pseudomonas viridiflava]
MRSPICHLEFQITGAPFSVAPEKAGQCAKQRDDHKIDFVMVDEPKFGFRVRLEASSQTPEVVLPIASLEYLWAFSHHCWVLTQEYAESQHVGAEQFDCVGNQRLRESAHILEWAKANLTSTGTERWPESGPRPKEYSHSCDDWAVATELFLCAIAWILHHEIAHVVLHHPLINTAFSEQEEREADKHATKWLLDGLPQCDPKLKKRALGIAVAVLCLQSLEVGSGSCLRNTHPAAHDRIFKNTATYQVGNDEVIDAICSVVLQYLFHDTGITANVDGATFSDILGDLLYDISLTKNDV